MSEEIKENASNMAMLGMIHQVDKVTINHESRLTSVEGQVAKQWTILETMKNLKFQVGLIVAGLGIVFGGAQTIAIAVLIQKIAHKG